MLERQGVEAFLDALASAAPTPGGGGAAAVMGAMGAALLSMVCNLTIGKKAYVQVEQEMQAALAQAEALRAQMLALVDEDAVAFSSVMAAYGLPRKSDAEKAQRKQAIQHALQAATMAPLRCAQASAEVIALAKTVAGKGNRNVVSDAGVAVAAAHAALRSSALNVYINTGSIDDEEFAKEKLEALETILDQAGMLNETVYADVVRALG
jgi:formiminotetrahydrofolate cyclodeaminase